jgi:hypothetical protein
MEPHDLWNLPDSLKDDPSVSGPLQGWDGAGDRS